MSRLLFTIVIRDIKDLNRCVRQTLHRQILEKVVTCNNGGGHNSMSSVHTEDMEARGQLTEEPAQKGHEFRMGGELLRDRAPKDSATMEPPSSSCSKPSESSGRPGSSSRDPPPAVRVEADKPRGRFR